ncbi:MAG TPA: tetratricopeptide repeat protein, partial [bacterium]|nr:tetratricopeptide repeat protein [bacterium]
MSAKPYTDKPVLAMWLVSLAGVLVLVAHLAAALKYSNWCWGFNHYYFLEDQLIAVTIGLGCVLCLPPVWAALDRLRHPKAKAPRASRTKGPSPQAGSAPTTPSYHADRRGLVTDVAIAAAASVIFWLLRMPYHFLGDGRLLIRLLDQGNWFRPTEFLDGCIHFAVLQAGRALWNWDGSLTYAAVSVAAGFGYVLAALRLGRLLRHHFLVTAALVTLGTVQLFCGYAECYSLATAAILIYMLLALEYLAGHRSFVWVGAALVIGVALHAALLFLVPSYLYLAFGHARARAATAPSPDSSFVAGKDLRRWIWLLTPLVLITVTELAASRPWRPGRSALMLLPPFRDQLGQYALFSWKHLIDLINHQVLISPLAWIGLVAFLIAFCRDGALKHSPRFRFLLAASIFPLGFNVILRPALGGSRDWDLWSMGVLPYVVTVVTWIASQSGRRPEARHAARVLAVVGFFHILPWIAINHSAALSLDFFQRISYTNPLWPLPQVASSQSELGHFYLEHNEPDEALTRLKRAVEADPGKARYWDALGVTYIYLKQYSQAEAKLRRAVELDPKDSSAYNNLGQAYVMLGRPSEAEAAFEQAVALDPNAAAAYFNLGKLY